MCSFVLDYFDGLFARLFNQTSKFGGILDMLTDRMGTLILYICIFDVMTISKFKCLIRDDFSKLHDDCENKYEFINVLRGYLFLNMFTDLVSHWCQTIVAASKGDHHKLIKNRFKLLDYYYG